MSPRRQPLSLYQHCVNYMSHSLDSLALYYKGDYDHPQIHAFLNCLCHYLPSFVCEAIGETIIARSDRQQTYLNPSHIRIFLNLKVKRLSLQGSVLQSEVLQDETASHLKSLTLFYGRFGDSEIQIQNFLYTANQLTHLECVSFCTNSMLNIIASSCPNLFSLSLRVSDVTDEGILSLCGLTENLVQCINLLRNGKRLIAKSKCSLTLKEIKLSMTNITEAGVAIILLVLTNICLLRVPDIRMEKIFTFLKLIDHNGIQNNLKEFHSREILDESQLRVLTDLCPNLEYIQMSFIGNFDVDLIRLHELTRLKKLSGAKFADVDMDALIHFLMEIGSQLKYLMIYIFKTKDSQEGLKISHSHLWNLARLCPNMKGLTLEGYNLNEDSNFDRNNGNSFHFFQGLQTLKLLFMKLSIEDLKLFLTKCTNMRFLELKMKDPHVLNDNFINELLKEGVWKNLNHLNTVNSHITLNMMKRLVEECPNLQSLGSVITWHITRDQMMEFKEIVRKQNLNIEIS